MAYADEVLADTPRIYWKFDETGGTTANDSSAGGTFDGTIAGSWTLNETTAPNGDVAARCTGNGGTHKTSVTHASHTPAAYSVELWVKPYTLYDYSCYVNDWDTAAGYGNGMMYSTALGGLGGGQDYNGTPPLGVFGTVDGRGLQRDVIRVGEWTHLVYTNDGSMGRFYKNGKLLTYVPCGIGASTETSLAWGDCAYAHFAQYDTALSPARIQAHYEAMVGAPTAPFIVGTTMHEATGGAVNVPLPYGAAEGDIVLITAAGNDDAEVGARFFLDGLATGYVFDSNGVDISGSASWGRLNATAIANGYLRARNASNADLPTSRYYSFAMVVIRPTANTIVKTAPTSENNSATATNGDWFFRTIAGVDDSTTPWSVARNKTSSDAYDFLGAIPQRYKTNAYAWFKVNGDSSFSTSLTAGSAADEEIDQNNWVVGEVAPFIVSPDFTHLNWQLNSALVPTANSIRLAVNGAGSVARSAWWKDPIDVNKLRVSVTSTISGTADSISVGFSDPAYEDELSVGGTGGDGGYLNPNVVGTFLTLDRWNSQIRLVYANAGGSSSTSWTKYYSVTGAWRFEMELRPYGSPDLHWLTVRGYQGSSLIFTETTIATITDLSYFGFVGATGGSSMTGDFSALSMAYMVDSKPATRQKRPVNRGAMLRAVR